MPDIDIGEAIDEMSNSDSEENDEVEQQEAAPGHGGAGSTKRGGDEQQDSTPEAQAENQTQQQEEQENAEEGEDQTEDTQVDEPEQQDTYDSIAEEYGLTHAEVQAARRSKLSPEDLRAMTPEAAKRVVDVQKGALDEWARKLGRIGEQAMNENQQQQQSEQPQERQQTPPPEENAQQQAQQAVEGMSEAEIDELDMPEAAKQQMKQMKQELDTIKGQFNQQRQQQFQQAVRQAVNVAEQHLHQLPEQYKQKLGTESIFEMDQDTPEYNNRKELLDLAGRIRAGAVEQGEDMSIEEAVNAALSVKEPELLAQQEKQRIVQQAEQQKKQVMGSGGSRREDTPSRDREQAANRITQNAPDSLKNL